MARNAEIVENGKVNMDLILRDQSECASVLSNDAAKHAITTTVASLQSDVTKAVIIGSDLYGHQASYSVSGSSHGADVNVTDVGALLGADVNVTGSRSTVCTAAGVNCIFPFTYQGVTYDSCGAYPGKGGELSWCKTDPAFSDGRSGPGTGNNDTGTWSVCVSCEAYGDSGSCQDLMGASDTAYYHCNDNRYVVDGSYYCGSYDDTDFTAADLCCACGGGSQALPALDKQMANANANAKGDPHLQNVLGQRFDLMVPGVHTLINIPRGAADGESMLRISADAQNMGAHCGDLYFQALNVTGQWLEASGLGALHFRAADAQRTGKAQWMTLGKADIKVVHGITTAGVTYLNILLRNLKKSGLTIGGLLGEDSHELEATPTPGCESILSLLAVNTEHYMDALEPDSWLSSAE
jgi:hypothetical protein